MNDHLFRELEESISSSVIALSHAATIFWYFNKKNHLYRDYIGISNSKGVLMNFARFKHRITDQAR